MKVLLKCTFLFFLTTSVFSGYAQTTVATTDSAKLLIDTALVFAQKNSIYREKVNWKQVEDSVRA